MNEIITYQKKFKPELIHSYVRYATFRFTFHLFICEHMK